MKLNCESWIFFSLRTITCNFFCAGSIKARISDVTSQQQRSSKSPTKYPNTLQHNLIAGLNFNINAKPCFPMRKGTALHLLSELLFALIFDRNWFFILYLDLKRAQLRWSTNVSLNIKRQLLYFCKLSLVKILCYINITYVCCYYTEQSKIQGVHGPKRSPDYQRLYWRLVRGARFCMRRNTPDLFVKGPDLFL